MSDFGGTFDPLADAIPGGPEPVDLQSFLLATGVGREEVEQATVDGTLELLALEKLAATEPPAYELDEVATLAGVTPERIRSYWRALGFPDPRPGEKLFGDRDLAVLSDVVWFISHGALEPGVALQMARVIGSSLDRIARAQVDAIETRRAGRDDHDVISSANDAHLAMRRGAELLPMMPKVMELTWRRHLVDAARRRRLRALAGEGDQVCVGFADLVGFTAHTQELDEEELAEVVGRFESIAYDVVSSHGGRVVKMIGDEVMFVTDGVRPGAELALALAETYRDDDALSDVRVGLASGAVLEREGDVYGPVVNLASRIVNIAYPGTVVVGEDIFNALDDDDAVQFKRIRQHYLKDIGRVRLWTMRRVGDEMEQPYPRARARRSAERELLVTRQAERLAASGALPDDVEEEVVGILEDAGLLDQPGFEDALGAGNELDHELQAVTEAVLAADIDEDLQVQVLADIEFARRLAQLEREAEEKALAADIEAEGRIEQIEAEARRTVQRIELDARRRIEEALEAAEHEARLVNDEAGRKARQAADEVERRAGQASKRARKIARRQAAQRRDPDPALRHGAGESGGGGDGDGREGGGGDVRPGLPA